MYNSSALSRTCIIMRLDISSCLQHLVKRPSSYEMDTPTRFQILDKTLHFNSL